MGNVEEHFIKVERTARYVTAGELCAETPVIWIVFHGYGQLATNMITNFHTLADHEHYIIAPEGLSRFYWDGMTGQPGASWMTKEERLHEIEDYTNYLSKLFHQLHKEFPSNAQINVLGFSQGVATATRWLAHEQLSVARLIIWAGEMPHDVDYGALAPHLSDTEIYMVLGLRDPFITTDQMEQQKRFAANYLSSVETINFDGTHRLDEDTLLRLAALQD